MYTWYMERKKYHQTIFFLVFSVIFCESRPKVGKIQQPSVLLAHILSSVRNSMYMYFLHNTKEKMK